MDCRKAPIVTAPLNFSVYGLSESAREMSNVKIDSRSGWLVNNAKLKSLQFNASATSWKSAMLGSGTMHFFLASTIAMSTPAVHGARFLDVGDLLRVASSPKKSPADSFFQWMILLSSRRQMPQALVSAIKRITSAYQVRTMESLQQWNTSDVLSHVDYKIIAIGIAIGDLRKALNIYVSLVQRWEATMARFRGTLATPRPRSIVQRAKCSHYISRRLL